MSITEGTLENSYTKGLGEGEKPMESKEDDKYNTGEQRVTRACE